MDAGRGFVPQVVALQTAVFPEADRLRVIETLRLVHDAIAALHLDTVLAPDAVSSADEVLPANT